MSQQILVRGSAPSRRGASLVAIVIAIAVLGGAIYGGLYWYSNSKGKDAPGKTSDASVAVKGYLGDLEDSLAKIEKEPAKVDEEIENITKLANEDITDLAKQVATAPADVKLKIVAMITENLPKLQTAIDAAYKIPGVQAKLEPLVTKLMAALTTLGK